ncbi:MAG: hypothetical protein QW838_05905 [Candidatus Nitrosotenuis sp.]
MTTEEFRMNGMADAASIPGEADILVKPPHGGQNPAGELFKFPLNPEEWIMRSDLSDEEVVSILELETIDEAVMYGRVDWRRAAWLYAGLVNSRSGKARSDYKEAIIGIGRRWIGSLFDRLNNVTYRNDGRMT